VLPLCTAGPWWPVARTCASMCAGAHEGACAGVLSLLLFFNSISKPKQKLKNQ